MNLRPGATTGERTPGQILGYEAEASWDKVTATYLKRDAKLFVELRSAHSGRRLFPLAVRSSQEVPDKLPSASAQPTAMVTKCMNYKLEFILL